MDNHSARALVEKSLKPTRSRTEIQADLRHAHAQIAIWNSRSKSLERELGSVVAHETPPHPFHGKKVRRRVKTYLSSEWRTQRGTMQQNTNEVPLYVGSGALYQRVEPGAYWVRTQSGKGAYDVRVGSLREPWELDE